MRIVISSVVLYGVSQEYSNFCSELNAIQKHGDHPRQARKPSDTTNHLADNDAPMYTSIHIGLCVFVSPRHSVN